MGLSRRIDYLLLDEVHDILHISNGRYAWRDPTLKEINILRYLARHERFLNEQHPVNLALRPYYKKRLKRGNRKNALIAYQKNYPSLPGMEDLLKRMDGFLDKTGTGLKGPSRNQTVPDETDLHIQWITTDDPRGASIMEGRVPLGQGDPSRIAKATQWLDTIRHLNDLAESYPDLPHIDQLRQRLAVINNSAEPMEKVIADHFPALKSWMDTNRDGMGPIPWQSRLPQLLNTVQSHLDALTRLTNGESLQGSSRQNSHAPLIEVVVNMEQDPIETLHLGWPNLGGTNCLDCVDGKYQEDTAGYILNPTVRVVYVKDKAHPEKPPLARISVALDPVSKTIFPISSIRASVPYDFRPLIGRYLLDWSQDIGVKVFAPESLGYDARLGPEYQKAEREFSFFPGLINLYNDLTGDRMTVWTKKVSGWYADSDQRIPLAASILDKSLRAAGFHKRHPILYSLYSVFGVNWEAVFHLPVLAVMMFAHGFWAWPLAAVMAAATAYIFSWAHPKTDRHERNLQFAVGLVLSGIFLLPGLTEQFGWDALFISMGTHSAFNSVRLLFSDAPKLSPFQLFASAA
jgi:hypothetical protein